ncbi:helix-turn-helix domain-containing protein [Bacillus toyonensis]|uniref:helix-turn-helix domain-containing protein n=1 Tax=Bacillus toyonensis TaxID=155322 RepID=UPI001C735401|nr:helix-turn-helix transcriptional regulator [Bacillus toyonensis]MBX0354998.1 helix-turn-helix domain-containing protein [Bacillus toyonensis]
MAKINLEVIIIIGLERIIKVFNFNANQIAKELSISRYTVYDWLKGRRKIPQERIDQLAEIPEFRYVNKELFQKVVDDIDEIEIEISRSKYLSDRDSTEVEDDFYGIPVPVDPYAEDRQILIELKDIVQEIERAKSLVFNKDYLEGLRSPVGERYLGALTILNDIFKQNDVNKINIAVEFLSVIKNELTDEVVKDLRKILQK